MLYIIAVFVKSQTCLTPDCVVALTEIILCNAASIEAIM